MISAEQWKDMGIVGIVTECYLEFGRPLSAKELTEMTGVSGYWLREQLSGSRSGAMPVGVHRSYHRKRAFYTPEIEHLRQLILLARRPP